MKHISEILPNIINKAEVSSEINRLANRHIAKLFNLLEQKNSDLSFFEKEAVKTQIRMLQDDITNYVCGVIYEKYNK